MNVGDAVTIKWAGYDRDGHSGTLIEVCRGAYHVGPSGGRETTLYRIQFSDNKTCLFQRRKFTTGQRRGKG